MGMIPDSIVEYNILFMENLHIKDFDFFYSTNNFIQKNKMSKINNKKNLLMFKSILKNNVTKNNNSLNLMQNQYLIDDIIIFPLNLQKINISELILLDRYINFFSKKSFVLILS